MSSAPEPQSEVGYQPLSREVLAALEPHLEALVEEYLERRQAGEEPDTYALLMRHLALVVVRLGPVPARGNQ